MTIAEALARPLLAGVFVYSGIDTLRNPSAKVPVATPILDPLSKADRAGARADRHRQRRGRRSRPGSRSASGLFPRPAAAVLAASLVPTTFAGHRFWEQEGRDARRPAPRPGDRDHPRAASP